MPGMSEMHCLQVPILEPQQLADIRRCNTARIRVVAFGDVCAFDDSAPNVSELFLRTYARPAHDDNGETAGEGTDGWNALPFDILRLAFSFGTDRPIGSAGVACASWAGAASEALRGGWARAWGAAPPPREGAMAQAHAAASRAARLIEVCAVRAR